MKNKVIGITGTNGKTTTTFLVAHILNQCGIKAAALGNSGVAMTSEEAEKALFSDSVVVAELSSYQLETMNSKVLDAAVLLNITPDHLDRYLNMEQYAKAKMFIADFMKPNGQLYIEQNCFDQFGYLLNGKKAKTYGICKNSDLKSDSRTIIFKGQAEVEVPKGLFGKVDHDLENFLAAYALCRELGVAPRSIVKAFETFKKPAHRIEFVRELNGVKYFDDSKGTNLDAVIKAVQAMSGEVVLIAGGVDKGAAYTPWIEAFGKKVSCILAIGQAAPKIEKDLSHAIPVKLFDSMQSAVQFAAKLAKPGSNILLSPGCSSFDMFKDYAHRGQEFQRMVNRL